MRPYFAFTAAHHRVDLAAIGHVYGKGPWLRRAGVIDAAVAADHGGALGGELGSPWLHQCLCAAPVMMQILFFSRMAGVTSRGG
jgi:hypothetical protein